MIVQRLRVEPVNDQKAVFVGTPTRITITSYRFSDNSPANPAFKPLQGMNFSSHSTSVYVTNIVNFCDEKAVMRVQTSLP